MCLCEKPFTANADEAAQVAEVAKSSNLVVMQAFHYRYHALTQRMLEILRSDELGTITRLDAWLCFPLVSSNNIRWSYELAGGALMDAGCYPIHLLRTLAGAEPEVLTATAKTRLPNVDRYLHAELSFGDGVTGSITASMLSGRVLGAGARVRGTRGTMRILNPYFPQFGHRLLIKSANRDCRRARRPAAVHVRLPVAGLHCRSPAGPTTAHRRRRCRRHHARHRCLLPSGRAPRTRTERLAFAELYAACPHGAPVATGVGRQQRTCT